MADWVWADRLPAGDERGGGLGGGGGVEDGLDLGVAAEHLSAIGGISQETVEFGFHILFRETGGNQFFNDLLPSFACTLCIVHCALCIIH